MSDNTQNDLMSFLGREAQADTSKSDVQSQEVDDQELDTDESENEDYDTDGYDSTENDDESTADYDDEESEDDDGSTDTESSTKATSIDDDDFTITVDGEELTVKGSELKSGYMRREAFTKKTQEVAMQRKALDAELTKAIERSEAVKFNALNEIERLDGVLKQLGGWDGLRSKATPEEYEQFHRMYVTHKKDSEMANDIYNSTVDSMRSNNAKMIENIFKDLASTRSDFNQNTMNELNDFLTKRGFTEDMVLSMTDSAAWELVLDAMAYNKLQARTKETVNKEPKNKTHISAPTKQTQQKSSKKREFEKGLKKQKSTRGGAQDSITTDLLKKLL